MILKKFIVIFSLLLTFHLAVFAQEIESVKSTKDMDSVRNKLNGSQDSLVPTAIFIRYTNLKLLKDSIQTLPLDTTLHDFQYHSPLNQPYNPMIGTGNLGLAAQSLLYNPSEIIGFDAGFHSLDSYRLKHEDITYYRARSPFTSLYYTNARVIEQTFRVAHSQNITKNWNVGANFNRMGSEGFYGKQRGDILSASLQTWFRSKNNRYNLISSLVFNTLKASENGGLKGNNPFAPMILNEPNALGVNLTKSRNIWRDNGLLIRQSYFIGRLDSITKDSVTTYYPTNKFTHTFKYANRSFAFQKLEPDDYSVIPKGVLDTTYTNDTTNIKLIQNEFLYTFFLRGKNAAFIKNEIKINAGVHHDFYIYKSFSIDSTQKKAFARNESFQNISLIGDASYRFSDKMNLAVFVNQLVQGRNAGDFEYKGMAQIFLGKNFGSFNALASIQNKSPELIYNTVKTNHFQWNNNFDRTKTSLLSFNYLNEKFHFEAKMNYFLMNNYLYFEALDSVHLKAMQYHPLLNLIQLSVKKSFYFKKFRFETFITYQKTDNANILRTPEFYTFNSISIKQSAFKVFKFEIGIDALYNTRFKNYAYTPALGQFYNSDRESNLPTYPVFNFWLKANLKRANFFLRYDYLNQGVFSKGYYTTEKYPMGNRILKFGLMWNFYN